MKDEKNNIIVDTKKNIENDYNMKEDRSMKHHDNLMIEINNENINNKLTHNSSIKQIYDNSNNEVNKQLLDNEKEFNLIDLNESNKKVQNTNQIKINEIQSTYSISNINDKVLTMKEKCISVTKTNQLNEINIIKNKIDHKEENYSHDFIIVNCNSKIIDKLNIPSKSYSKTTVDRIKNEMNNLDKERIERIDTNEDNKDSDSLNISSISAKYSHSPSLSLIKGFIDIKSYKDDTLINKSTFLKSIFNTPIISKKNL